MAGANLPAKKYTKTSPTQTRLSFECSGGSTQYIDIAKALSTVNRKFYRQGVYYYVNSVEVYNDETGVVDLHTLPDTWVTKNAHQRSFKLFQKMNAMVDSPMSMVGRPKYHDFKVYMSDRHRTTGSLEPRMHGINAAYSTSGMTPNDWVYSQFVSADDNQDGSANADEFNVHMIGGHVATSGQPGRWDSIGLIKSYGDSRHQPMYTDPSLPAEAATDPMLNIFDFSSEEQLNDIIENLDLDNDSPPYDLDYYVGESDSHMSHVTRIGTEQGVGRVGRASGFCAPFGLICVDPHGVSTAFRVVLNLAVGTYHGVYAERA
tara:strand:+ start:715 stop:1668 length:954 start_codon:yes stop_codon:yes gene_type:complete